MLAHSKFKFWFLEHVRIFFPKSFPYAVDWVYIRKEPLEMEPLEMTVHSKFTFICEPFLSSLFSVDNKLRESKHQA